MKIVISPAKSLDFETKLPSRKHTEPSFLENAKTVHAAVKDKSPKELSELMDISDKLAELNWQRNQEWKTPFTTKNARPAMYAFDGDVYTGLDAYTIPTAKLNKLQDSLRILSGLYGLLKPLDLIQPYRLEMGLKVPVITPEFRDYKDGQLKMISFFAKKARGMMVRYIIDKNVKTLKGLKGFDYEGYKFDAKLSKGNTLVFTR